LRLCASVVDARGLGLPNHWMRKWFFAALHLELQENRKGLQAYAGLVLDIPASSIGVVQMAVGHYNMREFDRAQSIFEDVYRADPVRAVKPKSGRRFFFLEYRGKLTQYWQLLPW
jgi:anaphase-promoting complex subunit 8